MTPKRPWSDRGSRHERGYGKTWDRLRTQILRRDSFLCQVCLADGERIAAAHAVDHRIPKALFASGKAHGNPDDPSNLRAICTPCHERVTLEQQGKRPKTAFDSNGNPTDLSHPFYRR